MKVLLIGGGGRESALAWALRRSEGIEVLRCAPGNAGIARYADRVPLAADDLAGLEAHVRSVGYDLVVIGPEAPLVAGLADRLRDAGVSVFGPSAAAAVIEGSKAFAKEFMARHGIPTAAFRVFDDPGEATRFLLSEEAAYPIVIKADGLAAGKGVVLAEEPEVAVDVASRMLTGNAFGDAGRRIVVEERLRGLEASYFALSDGETFVDLATCQDYKRVEDGDRGANTGGMGAYSPSVYLDGELRKRIRETIVAPTIAGMAAEGRAFRGVLFVGVMLTAAGPRVLEYNARFGDPETQVLVPRLDGDWLPLLSACADGSLSGLEPRWRDEAAVCIVMTSGGYPAADPKGARIHGLAEAEHLPGATVFHAATEDDGEGGFLTSGGRVLGITARGADLPTARERAYAAVSRIRWDGEHHRTDIALDAVQRVQGSRTA